MKLGTMAHLQVFVLCRARELVGQAFHLRPISIVKGILKLGIDSKPQSWTLLSHLALNRIFRGKFTRCLFGACEGQMKKNQIASYSGLAGLMWDHLRLASASFHHSKKRAVQSVHRHAFDVWI